MSLSIQQALFLQDAAELILWANRLDGVRVRAGHLFRSIEEQVRLVNAGASRTLKSAHVNRLAIDLILDLWSDTESRWVYQTSSEAYGVLGAHWESLSPNNVWGGRWINFPDGNHFERRP